MKHKTTYINTAQINHLICKNIIILGLANYKASQVKNKQAPQYGSSDDTCQREFARNTYTRIHWSKHIMLAWQFSFDVSKRFSCHFHKTWTRVYTYFYIFILHLRKVRKFGLKKNKKFRKYQHKMVDIKKFTNIDLYGLIGVEISATESEVS